MFLQKCMSRALVITSILLLGLTALAGNCFAHPVPTHTLATAHILTHVSASTVPTPRVILYRDYDFQGPTKEVTTATDLKDFNDTVSSIVVLGGNWQFFTNYGFDGLQATLVPGVYPSVNAVGISNDTLSSLRPLS